MLKKLLAVALAATTMLGSVAWGGAPVDITITGPTKQWGSLLLGATGADVGVMVDSHGNVFMTPANASVVDPAYGIRLTGNIDITGIAGSGAGGAQNTNSAVIGVASNANPGLITDLNGKNITVTALDEPNGRYAGGYMYIGDSVFTGQVINSQDTGGMITVTGGTQTLAAGGLIFATANMAGQMDMNGTINVAGISVDTTKMAPVSAASGIYARDVGDKGAAVDAIYVGTSGIKIVPNTNTAVATTTAAAAGMSYRDVYGNITVDSNIDVKSRNSTVASGSADGVRINSLAADRTITLQDVTAIAGTSNNKSSTSFGFDVSSDVNGSIIGGKISGTTQITIAIPDLTNATLGFANARGLSIDGQLNGTVDIEGANATAKDGHAYAVRIFDVTNRNTSLTAGSELFIDAVTANSSRNGDAIGIALGQDRTLIPDLRDSLGTIDIGSVDVTAANGNAKGLYARFINGATTFGDINATTTTGNASGIFLGDSFGGTTVIGGINAGDELFSTGDITAKVLTKGDATGMVVLGDIDSQLLTGTISADTAKDNAMGFVANNINADTNLVGNALKNGAVIAKTGDGAAAGVRVNNIAVNSALTIGDVNGANGDVFATATKGYALGVTTNDVNGGLYAGNVTAQIANADPLNPLGYPYDVGGVVLSNINGTVETGNISSVATVTGDAIGYSSENVALGASVGVGAINVTSASGSADGFQVVGDVNGNAVIGRGITDPTKTLAINAVSTKNGTAFGAKVDDINGNLEINGKSNVVSNGIAYGVAVDNMGVGSKLTLAGDMNVSGNSAAGNAVFGVNVQDPALAANNMKGLVTTQAVTVANAGAGAAYGIHASGLGGTAGSIDAQGVVKVTGNSNINPAGGFLNVFGIGVDGFETNTNTITNAGVDVTNINAGQFASAIGIQLLQHPTLAAGLNLAANQLVTTGDIFAKANGGEADGIRVGSLASYDIAHDIVAESTLTSAHGIHTLTTGAANPSSIFNVTGDAKITGEHVGANVLANDTSAGILAAGANDRLNFNLGAGNIYENEITTRNVEHVAFNTGDITLNGDSQFIDTLDATVADGVNLTLDAANALADVDQVFNGGQIFANTNQQFNNLDDLTDGAESGITIAEGTVATLNNTIATQYDGIIDGLGGVNKIGTEDITLTGLNAYEGGTTIGTATSGDVGNIIITNVQGVGTGPVSIGDEDSGLVMDIDKDNNGTFINDVSGIGNWVKMNDGIVTITGNNVGFTGTGTLAMGGLVATSGVSLGSNNDELLVDGTTLEFRIPGNEPGDEISTTNLFGFGPGGAGAVSPYVSKTGLGTLIHDADIHGFSPTDRIVFHVDAGTWNGHDSIWTNVNALVKTGATLEASGNDGLTIGADSDFGTEDGSTLLVGVRDDNPTKASMFRAAPGLKFGTSPGTNLWADEHIDDISQPVFDTNFTNRFGSGLGLDLTTAAGQEEYRNWLADQEITTIMQQGVFELITDANGNVVSTNYSGEHFTPDEAFNNFQRVLDRNGAGDFAPLLTQDKVDNIYQAYRTRRGFTNPVGFDPGYAGLSGTDLRMTDLLSDLGGFGRNLYGRGNESYAGYRYVDGQDLANSLEAVQDTVKTFTRAVGSRAYNLGLLSKMQYDECGNPIGDCNPYRTRIWGGYTGYWGHANERGGDRGYDYNAHGFNVGVDHLTASGVAVGAAFGYSKGDYELKGGLADDSKIDNYSFALYGSFNHASGWFTNVIASYTRSNYDMNSQFSNSGKGYGLNGFVGSANWDRADYDSDTWSIGGSTGFDIAAACNLTITPSIGLYYFDTTSNTFDTTVGGLVARHGMKYARSSLEMPLDVTVKYDIPFGCDGANKVSILANGGYSYNFINKGTKIHGYGLGGDAVYGDGTQNLYSEGDSWGRKQGSSTWYAGAGVQVSVSRFDIGAYYQYVGRSNYNSHNLNVTAGVKF